MSAKPGMSRTLEKNFSNLVMLLMSRKRKCKRSEQSSYKSTQVTNVKMHAKNGIGKTSREISYVINVEKYVCEVQHGKL